LFIGKPQRTLVLRFHELDDMRDIRLPLRRPSQDAIENLLNPFFCHGLIISRRASQLKRRGINASMARRTALMRRRAPVENIVAAGHKKIEPAGIPG
jgi:hypothetical protein